MYIYIYIYIYIYNGYPVSKPTCYQATSFKVLL